MVRKAGRQDTMRTCREARYMRWRHSPTDPSHELRTPLAAMQAILSVMRTERRTPEDYEQALADLADETDRLRGLVEALLRLAHSDTQPLPKGAGVDLSALLRDVCESLRPLAEAKGLALNCVVPDGLSLTGDSDSLIRLFVNLVDNAITYTRRGVITVTAESVGRQIRAAGTDTGVGVAA